jgi:hypothetical protein
LADILVCGVAENAFSGQVKRLDDSLFINGDDAVYRLQAHGVTAGAVLNGSEIDDLVEQGITGVIPSPDA